MAVVGNKIEKIEPTLTYQLVISTVLLIPTIYFTAMYTLPEEFSFITGEGKSQLVFKNVRRFAIPALSVWCSRPSGNPKSGF